MSFDSLSGKAYDDLKSVLDNKVFRKKRFQKVRKERLTGFSKEFAEHPPSVSDLVDYYEWHEESDDWHSGKGKGRLLSATVDEMQSLWANREFYFPYETQVKYFAIRGVSVHRVFLLRGGEIATETSRSELFEALWRHLILKFDTRVAYVHELRKAFGKLGIRCGTAATLNAKIAYFLRLSNTGDPLLLRTVNRLVCSRADNVLWSLIKNSESAKHWLDQRNVPEAIRVKAIDEAEAIEAIATNWRDRLRDQ